MKLYLQCQRCGFLGAARFIAEGDAYRAVMPDQLIPEGWQLLRYEPLCPECSRAWERMERVFMENHP